MSLLEVKNVESGYGKTSILYDINFEIEKGEIVAMIGPNGSGKTTLLRTVSGILKVKKGQITFHGKEMENLGPDERVRRGIGYVLQDDNVFPTLTVMENLEMGAYILSQFQDRLKDIFRLFPILKERKRQKAGTLSGGERQMLAIASSLLLTPHLLMLDEPCGGLAPRIAQEVCDKILGYPQDEYCYSLGCGKGDRIGSQIGIPGLCDGIRPDCLPRNPRGIARQ